MRIDLERVIRFAAVAEQGSFSRAAQVLGVNQPWLSRQVMQLEERLGFSLFDRTTRRLQLTVAGREFLRQAQEVVAVADRTESLAQSLRRDLTATIRIGVLTSSYWASARHELLDLFRQRNRAVEVELVMGTTTHLIERLQRREVEAVIGVTAPDDQHLDRLMLQRSRPNLLIPNEHPLAGKATLHMRDLKDCPLATTDSRVNPANFEKTYGPFRDAGMRLRPVIEGKAAILHYARKERLFVLKYGDDNEEPAPSYNLVQRHVVECPAVIELWLYRTAGDDRPLVRKLWTVGEQISTRLVEAAEPQPAVAG